MKIYFAGSIRGGREDKHIYGDITKLLSFYGRVLTEHVADRNLTERGEDRESSTIYTRDMAWLHEADKVIAEVTTPSLGVGYEVAKAEELHKPMLCIYRPSADKKLSAMISGNKSLMNKEYHTVEDLKTIFQEFFRT